MEKVKRKPLDLHFILGTDENSKQILKVDLNLELKSDEIIKICQQCQLKQPVGDDVIFKFDFVIQEGRQKQCLQYFENGLDQNETQGEYDHDLSPLQNWFKRPKKSGKLQLYEAKRKDGRCGVTLQYRFYKQFVQKDQEFAQVVTKFKQSSFNPDLNINLTMLGKAEVSKKNRIRMKADYIDFHISSNQFKVSDVQNLFQLLSFLSDSSQQQMAQIYNHPMYKFISGSQEIQATFKMAAIRKWLQLYEIGLNSGQQHEPLKDYPQVLKGLFKEQLRISLIYSNKLAFIADCTYENQAVLLRLLSASKKYYKYID